MWIATSLTLLAMTEEVTTESVSLRATGASVAIQKNKKINHFAIYKTINAYNFELKTI
jgi:hypothetical protein